LQQLPLTSKKWMQETIGFLFVLFVLAWNEHYEKQLGPVES